MIRCERNGGVWLFTQTVHAFMCGQLARLWDAAPLEPCDEMLLAALHHDAGWLERDDMPQINAQGKPRTFTELDLDDHFQVWERSITRTTAANRYAGLIVSLHSTNLYERRLRGGHDTPQDQAKIRAYLDKQCLFKETVQQELAAHYGELVENDHLKHNREQLQAWDWMSLLLCMGQPRSPHEVRIGGEEQLTLAVDESGMLVVSPWVFAAESITLYAEGRWLDQQIFEDDAQLQRAFRAASLQMRMFHLRGNES